MQIFHWVKTKWVYCDLTAMLVGDLISLCGYKRREPAQCCCAVIAGELGCLSMITYILCPPPAALVISLSDFHHPLPMFSLTPCIYNMLEQPLECKDPAEALTKTHTFTLGFATHNTHTDVVPCDMTREDLAIRRAKITPAVGWLDLKRML